MSKGLTAVLAIVLSCAVLVLVGRMAGDRAFWIQYGTANSAAGPDELAAAVRPRLVLPGAPEAQPLATAEAELMAPEALVQVTVLAQKLGARALLVHRHGHRILEVFGDDTTAATPVTGGELAPAVLALALAPLVDTRRVAPEAAVQALREYVTANNPQGWRNPWSAAARRRFALPPPPPLLLQDAEGSVIETLSRRVWQPLHADHAALWGGDDGHLRLDCCVVAQLGDWMRVGDVLLQQGSLEGERLASPDWIRALLPPDEAGRRHPVWVREQLSWSGAEPPAARDTSWFDLGKGVRLWLVPRRGLAILYWAGSAAAASDTELPNLLIRGLVDQALPIAAPSLLEQIVPGH